MRRKRHEVLVLSSILVGAVIIVGCGGGMLGPSGSQGVTLRGESRGLGASSTADVSGMSASAGEITVKVLEAPAITAKVGSDGSFTLRGLPDGTFTLVFTDAGGTVLGTLVFSEVRPNQEITITVDFSAGGVRLVEERRNGVGHGDIEIEGRVGQVLTVNMAGDSTFVINGYTVVARPGVTSIREGNRRRTVEDVTNGRQVHVKGEWLPPTGGTSSQPVLAHEIKLQGGGDDGGTPGGGDDGEKITICHKSKETITISINAWPAHQAHGDTKGPCK